MLGFYRRTPRCRAAPPVHDPDGVLRHHRRSRVISTSIIPKGFFPTQDTGLMTGFAEAAQDVSPQEMKRLMVALGEVVASDPDVAAVGSAMGSTGSAQTANTGRFFIALKPRDERQATRARTSSTGCARSSPRSKASASCCSPRRTSPSADASAAASTSTRCRTPISTSSTTWAPKVLAKLQTLPELADVLERSAEQRAAARHHHQPRCGGALRHPAPGDRRHAQRRVRPAPGRAILHADQHLYRGAGGAAGAAEAISPRSTRSISSRR